MTIYSYLTTQSRTNPLRFYVYAYLRSENSEVAEAGTPYYIGKGTHGRAWDKKHNTIKNLEKFCRENNIHAPPLKQRGKSKGYLCKKLED